MHGGRSLAPLPERGPEGVSQAVRRQSNKTQINPSAEARKEEAGPINCSWGKSQYMIFVEMAAKPSRPLSKRKASNRSPARYPVPCISR